MDAQHTGNIITEKRKNLNLTQKDVAEKLHVSISAVSKWERGLNFPDLSLMEPLSDLLEISVSELLGIENAPTEEVVRNITSISVEESKSKNKMLLKVILAITISISITIAVTYFASLLAEHFLGSYEKMFPLYIIGYICFPISLAFALISIFYAIKSSTNKFLYFSSVSLSSYLLSECVSQVTTMSYIAAHSGFGSWEIFSKHGIGFVLCFGIIVINSTAIFIHRKFK